MRFGKEIRFTLSVLLCAIVLHLFGYDDQRVALLRLEQQLRVDSALSDVIALNCQSVTARDNRIEEKFFLEQFSPKVLNPEGKRCFLAIESSSTTRFHLQSHWVFMLSVHSESGAVAQRTFHIGFPTPLCLLPFVIFIFALIFEFRSWKFYWLLATYLFLLGGANFIQTTNLIWESLNLTFKGDQTFIGFALVILWLALNKSARDSKVVPRVESTVMEGVGNRAASMLFGLWNPGFYTVLGRVLFPFRAEVARLANYFNSQVLVASLSLYLLSFEFRNLKDFLGKNLILPRYFTYTVILFSLINLWREKPRPQVVLWHFPHFWRAFSFVVGAEILAHYSPYLEQMNTISRMGAALVFSELLWPQKLSPALLAKNFLPWFGALIMAFMIPIASYQSGLTDLVLVILDPKIHPNSYIFFTFFASLMAAFFTGSFSITFLAILNLLVKINDQPLVRAALLDGILAGTLLSPLSLYNLLPSVQFGIDIKDLITSRFRYLGFPLLIGTVVYMVSMLHSVAILRPLTFVFLCLVALAIQLKRSSWTISRESFLLTNERATT